MRKTLIFIIGVMIFLLLSSSLSYAYEKEIKSLSIAMAGEITKVGKKRVAVVDFTDLQGNITELGRFLAEEISAELTITGKGFEVIDRNHLRRILEEHRLSLSGIVDLKTVRELGKIAGVDALITGSITPLEGSVRVVCKVIATDTARVIGATKGDIPRTKAIEELFGKEIKRDSGQPAPFTEQKEKPQTKTVSQTAAKGYTFQAKSCKLRQDNTAICGVTVINNQEDARMLQLDSSSLLYDNLGNQYRVSNINVGKRVERGPEIFTPPHVPIDIFLIFENVSPEAQSVWLHLFWGVRGEGGFEALIHNIPLSR